MGEVEVILHAGRDGAERGAGVGPGLGDLGLLFGGEGHGGGP